MPDARSPDDLFDGASRLTVDVTPAGDAAALLTVLGADAERRWQCAHRLAAHLSRLLTLHGVIPTFDTVLVEYDPVVHSIDDVRSAARVGLLDADFALADDQPRRVRVPVVFGVQHGPDLERVAEECGLSTDELIGLHVERPRVIRCVVSPAGSPMTDGPLLPVPVARLRTPRTSVEPGSIGLAGRQAMVYAIGSPGGWRIIGRTPARLVDPSDDPPVRYRAGDRLEYLVIGPQDWSAYWGKPPEIVRA